MRRRRAWLILGVLTLALLGAGGYWGLWTTSLAYGDVAISEDVAIEQAIAHARVLGLQQERPDAFAIKLMTLEEAAALMESQLGADAGQFGLHPHDLVWMVTMRGPVIWASFGAQGNASDHTDNVTVVLDAQTGAVRATHRARDGRLPLAVL
jgi:hypothetical protein